MHGTLSLLDNNMQKKYGEKKVRSMVQVHHYRIRVGGLYRTEYKAFKIKAKIAIAAFCIRCPRARFDILRRSVDHSYFA
jgi:hypothetical protein